MNLLKWRTKAKMSQAELARQLGVLPSVVSRWERRERTPRAEHIAKIQALTRNNVKLADLVRKDAD